MYKFIVSLLVGVAVVIVMVITYWLTGLPFERNPDLAGTFIMTILLTTFFVFLTYGLLKSNEKCAGKENEY